MQVEEEDRLRSDDERVPDAEEEGSGAEVANTDSSEEEPDDEEEAARIRDGFIVDEDEEEEEQESDSERKRRRRKRRKRHHHKRDSDENDDGDDGMQLDEDDLELLAEQGASVDRNRRLYKRQDATPQRSTSKRAVVVNSDEELDDVAVPEVQDIHRIWDDAREEEDDYMEDFIDDDDDEDTPMDQEAREELRRQKQLEKMQRRKATRAVPPALEGLDASAWVEIHDVFGDGHDYDWALGDDDDLQQPDEMLPKETRVQDVFEPSEIASRFLTEDDDLIRARDIPERLQLATSTLSKNSMITYAAEFDPAGAAVWIIPRLSPEKQESFFGPNAVHQHLVNSLVAAVTRALEYMFVDHYEVPYIWTHKRDYMSHFDVNDIRSRTELLNREDLWRIHSLGQKYKSLLDRRRILDQLFTRLDVTDEYFTDEIRPHLETVETVADATEWLSLKYKGKRKQDVGFAFHDDDEDPSFRRQKLPSRISAYEVAKGGIVSRLADEFGIQPHQVVLNMLAGQKSHFVVDQDLPPLVAAEGFCGIDQSSNTQDPEEALRRARLILATELGKDPLLRNEIRKLFKEDAVVTVEPTERGISKISDTHPYHNFKYLERKPVQYMLDSAQFLQILAAERELLVTTSISLPPESKDELERRLRDAFSSETYSESSRAWNEERAKVVREVLENFLLPLGAKWTREYLREEEEDCLAARAGKMLRERIDVGPYKAPRMALGETPSVLAVSWGKGDRLKDPITLVYLDKEGHLREHTQIDNFEDEPAKEEFLDLLSRKVPDVIAISGFTMNTMALVRSIKEYLTKPTPEMTERVDPRVFQIPIIYSHDDIARLYQHSARSSTEFATLSPAAKYCVGLARYVQNPLNEFAALGPDLTAITIDQKDQHLIPPEKLLSSFERALVDITNDVGVDINRAISNHYYQTLLPFVGGLGPRKAQALVKKIAALGGNIVNREQFVKSELMTATIFLNSVAFLRIVPNQDISSVKKSAEARLTPDPLDCTRIHPEDYDFARKMAADALELDEEDIHEEHPSHVVTVIMEDPENERKLNELNLDEFAVTLHETNQQQKRHTLNLIRDELLTPFADHRQPLPPMAEWEIVTMLSGETKETLAIGLIVPVQVTNFTNAGCEVRLDSGIEGEIARDYLADVPPQRCQDAVTKFSTVQGVVFDVKLEIRQKDTIKVHLSIRKQDVEGGDQMFRKVKQDQFWDRNRSEKDRELLQRKKRVDTERSRRVIKHPNFHNFNAMQAEAYLEKQQRGDLVIRPSSKGLNHLAVTWKVDDKLYQHIDVTEPNADPTGQTVGNQLIIDSRHTYSDLDELIVNHVQAMARRVEDLMAHERFKPGPEDELHVFLKNVLAANPGKSMYGFSLNRKKPGHFHLCFLASKQSSVQTWPVRVTPEAYYLFDTAAAGVPELCDAFKVRHLHESQNPSNAIGRTPYGAGGRTPARPGFTTTPGGALSTRHPARTPNPHSGSTPHAPFGGATPGQFGGSTYGAPPANNLGFQTPRPPGIPAGMNPQRAAMIQNQGGWGGGQGW